MDKLESRPVKRASCLSIMLTHAITGGASSTAVHNRFGMREMMTSGHAYAEHCVLKDRGTATHHAVALAGCDRHAVC